MRIMFRLFVNSEQLGDMDQLDAMRVFVRVAELASFTQAADGLGLPKATVSAAVQRLEAQLGTRLLQRTTRKVQLTQDGLLYLERSRDLLLDVDELHTLFTRDQAELSGRLRVDMSSGIAKRIVIPQLPAFLSKHPRLELELSSTDRRVDLVREGFDCVVRVGAVLDTSLIERPLGAFELINCISRGYAERHGLPQSLDDLKHHQLVHYVPTLGGKSAGFEYVVDGKEKAMPMSGVITVNSADAYQAACLAGLGLIQAPWMGVQHLLASGELVEVLPQYRAAPLPVSLLYVNRRQQPKRVRVFMDWLTEVMRPHCAG